MAKVGLRSALGAMVLVISAAMPMVPIHARQVASPSSYQRSSAGTEVLTAPNGLTIELLAEAAQVGGDEVEVAEITFPGGSRGGAHRHGAVEILYLLSGRMDHVVNGVSHVLEPGMVGIVRPEDTVEHRVLSTEPVRAVVIWAPGGEAARLRERFGAAMAAPPRPEPR